MTGRSGWYWTLLTLLILASGFAHGGHPGATPFQPTIELRAHSTSGHHASSSQTPVEEHAHAPCVIPRGSDADGGPGGVFAWTPEDMSGSGTEPNRPDRPPNQA